MVNGQETGKYPGKPERTRPTMRDDRHKEYHGISMRRRHIIQG